MQHIPSGKDWIEFIASRVGSRKWVVAGRLTDRLRRKGYEVALTQRAYSKLALEFGAALARARGESA